jgi:LytS/YehU family sensor histidine kinase
MVRFGHRLKVENNIDANTENRSLPTLLLQPIVENAIKFGLYGTTEQITIHITSKIQNDMLFIEITNPYDIEAHYANKGAGFGLNSIARRLYLLFGRNDLLKIHTKENIFITQILIPLQTA